MLLQDYSFKVMICVIDFFKQYFLSSFGFGDLFLNENQASHDYDYAYSAEN